jgi:hypothetical protein
MTTSSPGWDVQPSSPWISTSALPLIPLAMLVVAIAIHTTAVLIGFGIAMLITAAIMLILLWSLRQADARRLAAAPAGTFFVGQGSARLQSLRAEPRFASIAAGRRGMGVPGAVSIDETGIRFAPYRHRSGSPATAEITWDNLTSLRASVTPGKINVGWLDIVSREGAHLRFQIAGYSRLVTALDRASSRPT